MNDKLTPEIAYTEPKPEAAKCAYCDTEDECAKAKMCLGSLGLREDWPWNSEGARRKAVSHRIRYWRGFYAQAWKVLCSCGWFYKGDTRDDCRAVGAAHLRLVGPNQPAKEGR